MSIVLQNIYIYIYMGFSIQFFLSINLISQSCIKNETIWLHICFVHHRDSTIYGHDQFISPHGDEATQHVFVSNCRIDPKDLER
jgi:hypothetical protein